MFHVHRRIVLRHDQRMVNVPRVLGVEMNVDPGSGNVQLLVNLRIFASNWQQLQPDDGTDTTSC